MFLHGYCITCKTSRCFIYDLESPSMQQAIRDNINCYMRSLKDKCKRPDLTLDILCPTCKSVKYFHVTELRMVA